jgi:hypothetical protein
MYLNTLSLAAANELNRSRLVHSCFSDPKNRSIAALP